MIAGTRPLPHCFGFDRRVWAGDGSYGHFSADGNYIPRPSLKTAIPKDKRREWLIECFKECIVEYYGEKMTTRKILGKRSREEFSLPIELKEGVIPNFIKEFKELMSLPSDYELTRTKLFRMFLKELKVPEKSCYCHNFVCNGCPDNIDQLCLL